MNALSKLPSHLPPALPFLLPQHGQSLFVRVHHISGFWPALTTHCDLLTVTGGDTIDVGQLYHMFPGFVQKIPDVASMELLLGGRGGRGPNNTDIREGGWPLPFTA